MLDAEWQTANQVTITVKLNSLPEIVEYLYYQLGGWLPVLFGNDERTLTGDFAVYYVLSMEEGEKCFITVKAQVSAITLEFPSVTPRVPAAVWGEREIRDMYGLIPVGLPDERRLVLPDDWPDDLYPLRKDTMDYRQRPSQPLTWKPTRLKMRPPVNRAWCRSGRCTLPPMSQGIFACLLTASALSMPTTGCSTCIVGWRSWPKLVWAIRRSPSCPTGSAGSAASPTAWRTPPRWKMRWGSDVPPRAHAIRSILLEVERLHSHLLNIGLSSHFVGFDTGFMQFFRVREKSMTMAELLTGLRKTYGLNLIGGVRRDILKEQRVKTIKLIHEMRADVTQLVEMLLGTPNIEQRTKGIGLLDWQIARDYSPVGPMIRASGFKRDMRFDHPYANYGSLPKTLFTFDGCDVYSRVMVRVQEVLDSLAMIEYGLDNLPGGPLLTEGFRYQPHKFALGYAEAPRGEDIHWSMLGDNQKLFRWRCRAATYANWPVLRYMLRGNTVSDAPLIIGSLDPCYSCTDRVTLIDINKRKAKTVPYKEIERYGIERTNSPCK